MNENHGEDVLPMVTLSVRVPAVGSEKTNHWENRGQICCRYQGTSVWRKRTDWLCYYFISSIINWFLFRHILCFWVSVVLFSEYLSSSVHIVNFAISLWPWNTFIQCCFLFPLLVNFFHVLIHRIIHCRKSSTIVVKFRKSTNHLPRHSLLQFSPSFFCYSVYLFQCLPPVCLSPSLSLPLINLSSPTLSPSISHLSLSLYLSVDSPAAPLCEPANLLRTLQQMVSLCYLHLTTAQTFL